MRQAGRERARVPAQAGTAAANHDQGFPGPHRAARATAAAHTAGAAMATIVSAQARTSPTQALSAHDTHRRTAMVSTSFTFAGSTPVGVCPARDRPRKWGWTHSSAHPAPTALLP